MKVAIIGLGSRGADLLRSFAVNAHVQAVTGCELNGQRLEAVKNSDPSFSYAGDYGRVLADPGIDAVAVATPVETHYRLALEALETGKHAWVEKPLTSHAWQAKELVRVAASRNLVLFVDHTFVYHGPVMKIKEMIDAGELGEVLYYDAVHINKGISPGNVNVLWELAPHDFSIMHYLLGKKVTAVAANGTANVDRLENIAHVCAYFKDKCFAHFHLNRSSPVMIRRMIIGGSKKMVLYDEQGGSEIVKVHDSGISLADDQKMPGPMMQRHSGDINAPPLDRSGALSRAVDEFITAIREKRQPLTSGRDGLEVVKMVEAVHRSLRNQGSRTEI